MAAHTPGPWKWDGYTLLPEVPNPEASAVHTILEVETMAYGYVGSDLDATLGLDTIILLHNAAGILDEVGTEAARVLAAGLREKARLEFAAVAKATGGVR